MSRELSSGLAHSRRDHGGGLSFQDSEPCDGFVSLAAGRSFEPKHARHAIGGGFG